MERDYNGVKFYSNRDLSCAYLLQQLQHILDGQQWSNPTININRILELYNIKRFFDHDLRLTTWTEDEYSGYKAIVNQFD